jgi:hypothetical protein
MPHKPKYNFSEGVLQKLAQLATRQITESEMISWLYDHGTENPEQFLRERAHLLSAIGAVVEHYQKNSGTGDGKKSG